MNTRERFRQLLAEAPADQKAIEHDEVWTTWGDLRTIATQLDDALNARGLGPGTRVGIILENRPEHVAVLLGLIGSGRCVVTMSPLQPPQRLAADIVASSVPVLVGRAEALDHEGVRDAAGDAAIFELAPDAIVSGPATIREPRPEDVSPGVVVEMLTSGTTGPPKRVRLNERQFDTALSTSVPAPPEGMVFRSGVTLVLTPLVHIGGFWGALGPLYAGRSIVLMSKFSVEPWLRAVRLYRPKAFGLVPAALRTVLARQIDPADLESVQVITTGTAPCPTELIDAFLETYGIRVLPTYGATEFAGALATWSFPMHVKYWETKAGSAGRALPGVELRVTDPDGTVLPAGQDGLLEVRSAQSPLGADEWLCTSDLAAIDEDGFLWVRGRADDAIIRGGFKVHPDQVRKVLEQHPAVQEAAVAPIADERLGQVPVAAVELWPGVPAPQSGELVELCRAHLTPYEVPVHIVVLPALPRTPSSKVSRVDLVEQILAAVAQEVPV